MERLCGKCLEIRGQEHDCKSEEKPSDSASNDGLDRPQITWGELKKLAKERDVADDYVIEYFGKGQKEITQVWVEQDGLKFGLF